MASSDCTFETESLIPVSFQPEAAENPIVSGGTLQHGQHFMLQQSFPPGCAIPRGPAVEMVTLPCGGQDEQRSDSGRGASDEEVIFQGPFQPILYGLPVSATTGKAGTLHNHANFTNPLADQQCNGSSITAMTTTSGIYLCASSLTGQTATSSTSRTEANSTRSVSTFVSAIEKDTSSLPRGEVSQMPVSNVNKTFSLPREGLCMTKSLLDEHTADESANRLRHEIDQLLFDNMI